MATEQQRKSNAKYMNAYMGVIAGAASAYFLGYTGKVASEEGLSFLDGIGKTVEYLKDFQVSYVPTSALSIFGICGGVIMGFIVYAFLQMDTDRKWSYSKDKVAGTGGFMTPKDLKSYKETYVDEEGTYKDPLTGKVDKRASNNMIFAKDVFRSMNDRKTMRNNNVLVIGGAGTGKSRFLIKPNILQMNASFVVTDPSGEIVTSLGNVLKDNGYKIKIFNISDMTCSNCYNPLKYIRNESGVLMLIDCLIKNTTGKGEKGDVFFENAERLLYSACIFHLRDFETDSMKQTFARVFEMVNMSSVDENNAAAKSPLDLLFEQDPEDSLARKYYRAFKQAAGKTLKSIIISCVVRLQPFQLPQVMNLTKMDELELEKVGDEKTALFIITPQADRTFSFLASMLYSQLFETLYFRAEKQKLETGSERLKYPVRCLMDEFANIGEVPDFPSKLATMRKYNISATIVLQDKSQIEAMYKDEWKTLMANCDNILFLGSSENETLQYMSEKLGNETITTKSRGESSSGKGGSQNYQQTKREVMTPEEIGRMPNGKCLVFLRGERPAYADKYPYETHPHYKETADGDGKLFAYDKMAAYDNSSFPGIECLVKAESEAALFEESMEEVKEPEKDIISLNEAFDTMGMDRETEAALYADLVTECMEKVEKCIKNREGLKAFLQITSLDMVAPKLLGKIAATVSSELGINILGVFADNKDEYTFGAVVENGNYGIGNTVESCIDRDDGEDCVEENGSIMLKIRNTSARMDEFKSLVFDLY